MSDPDELTPEAAEFNAAITEAVAAGFTAAAEMERLMVTLTSVVDTYAKAASAAGAASAAYARVSRATAAMVGIPLPDRIMVH